MKHRIDDHVVGAFAQLEYGAMPVFKITDIDKVTGWIECYSKQTGTYFYKFTSLRPAFRITEQAKVDYILGGAWYEN